MGNQIAICNVSDDPPQDAMRLLFQAAFMLGYIVSGLFHFTGRHFFFWVEMAIFLYYIFYDQKIQNISSRRDLCTKTTQGLR